ncbi:Uncharacterised protein [Mycobacterium tuberculosis]|uniref:Uncharacterized protein n=1 Tax=Mycobacterium tuberculosis TaxID=1773 RepID=A0A0U0T9A3_MYCTX|nr:Uncharacterised protein [Mycobacterium tuberculosis]CKQ99772.1 Uncharacterised protein [Mycobacterium tuberculosis]CNV97227.1 Uncharacterised protein [Mycobacterium tuberculosis]COV13843.1 Uncharacterised protein [Mycobacterium tuberculosis]COW20383.1 Uncharacterised protein [Mycobacterium tuberculosis]
MLAQMHHGVRPETVRESGIEPAVGGQVVVAGRQVRVVVDRHRVLPEAARRLNHEHQVARSQCGDDDLAVRVVATVDEQLTGWRAPVRCYHVCQFGGQGGEPVPILLGRHPDGVAGQLAFGEPVGVVSAAFDQRVNQRVAVV